MKVWHGARKVFPCRFGGSLEPVLIVRVPGAYFTVVRVEVAVCTLKRSPEIRRTFRHNSGYVLYGNIIVNMIF